jgi:hypothetical protein
LQLKGDIWRQEEHQYELCPKTLIKKKNEMASLNKRPQNSEKNQDDFHTKRGVGLQENSFLSRPYNWTHVTIWGYNINVFILYDVLINKNFPFIID